jgi:NADH dehydrogenase
MTLMESNKLVTLIGGTGFVGRYVVKLLAERGYRIRIVARHTEAALSLRTAGEVGQIAIVRGDLTQPDALGDKIQRSHAVVNLAGILFESGRQNFSTLHAQGAEKLAQAAKAANVVKFIHLSALGVDRAVGSKYARTKAMGEKAVRAAFPEATMLRPSVIFGPEDQFFNKFAALAAFPGVLPVIGGGKTRFQPVYVNDVALAVLRAIELPAAAGRIYELGGPAIYSFREILEYIAKTTRRSPLYVPLSFGFAGCIGRFACLLPNPPLTSDQVALLHHDNIVGDTPDTLAALGIAPTAVETVVPSYLARYARPEFTQLST